MNFDLTHLKVAIRGCIFGKEIVSFKEISSTQDYAISVAEIDPYCHGMVIISESQLFGRGRNGKRWMSPPGGLWFSVITKSDIKPSSSIFLSYAMSLAVCETIADDYNLEAFIKWPNDVLIKRKKVAGILISSAVRGEDLEYCVVGAGINLNSRPKGMKGTTSLIEHIGPTSITLESFLASVLAHFRDYHDQIQSENWESVTKRWKSRCPMMGKWIKLMVDGVQLDGLASDIDSDGLLILITTRGQKVRISETQDVSLKLDL
ncbi:MAG: biotin--[acetyl-CoA-carboxylase] ligase [Nitrososphaeraceae archaeon]